MAACTMAHLALTQVPRENKNKNKKRRKKKKEQARCWLANERCGALHSGSLVHVQSQRTAATAAVFEASRWLTLGELSCQPFTDCLLGRDSGDAFGIKQGCLLLPMQHFLFG